MYFIIFRETTKNNTKRYTYDTGCLGLVHWDDPEGWYGEGGGRSEEGSGWGTHVYLWWIHFDIWQNQYNIVKLKKKKSWQNLLLRFLNIY